MNQATKTSRQALTPADEAEIAEYLLQYPDFLSRHPEALRAQHIPHTTGAAVSLVERQVSLLRKDAEATRHQLEQFIQVAKENDQLNNRLHSLTLALIEAQGLEELLSTLHDELHSQFRADAVELKLFSADEVENAVDDPALEVFQVFMDADRPTCGQLDADQLQTLFGDDIGDNGSAALIPVKSSNLSGIMAIGSRDMNRFHPGMAVDFLVRLGELVSLALQSVSVREE